MEPTLKVAKKFPNVKFEHATGFKRAPNRRDLFGPLLRGPLRDRPDRRQDDKDQHHRLCRRLPDSGSRVGHQRLHLGAKSVNPNIKVKIVWANTWFDPGKEADAAKALLAQGADIISQHTEFGRAAAGSREGRQASASARRPT